jgi:hypothetical protein
LLRPCHGLTWYCTTSRNGPHTQPASQPASRGAKVKPEQWVQRERVPRSTNRYVLDSSSKSQQHLVFPGGLPSKYYPGPTLLNFGDLTRTGAFNVVWPLASVSSASVQVFPEEQKILQS